MKKSVADREKVETELRCEIDELKAQVAAACERSKECRVVVVSSEVRLEEMRKRGVELEGVEEYNRKLKELVVKVGNEHSKELPEIYKSFDLLIKELLKEKENTVTKITCKEFASVEELFRTSSESLPSIARNCTRLLLALTRFHNEPPVPSTHYPCQRKLVSDKKPFATPDGLRRCSREAEESKQRPGTVQEKSKERVNVVTPQAIEFKNRKSRSTFISSADTNRGQSKDKALKGVTAEDVHESYANRSSERSNSKGRFRHKPQPTELVLEPNQVKTYLDITLATDEECGGGNNEGQSAVEEHEGVLPIVGHAVEQNAKSGKSQRND